MRVPAGCSAATLGDLQLTQAKLGDMATAIDAAALLTYRAAWQRDVRNERATKEAAMAKMTATESAQQVIDAAVQLFGGRGVTRGQVVERLYREIRALRIYEGATEVQKLIVGRELLGRRQEDAAMTQTAHVDTFARDHLPPRGPVAGPDLRFAGARAPGADECGDRAARRRNRTRLG